MANLTPPQERALEKLRTSMGLAFGATATLVVAAVGWRPGLMVAAFWGGVVWDGVRTWRVRP